jgi:hypothetical protein
MPRKQNLERPYDPISADLVRDAASKPHLVSRPPVTLAPTGSPAEPTITKRFVLTRSEDAEVNAFLVRLQEAARTKVPLGMLVRAVMWVLMEREEALLAEARGQTFRLPSTHDRLGQGEFEERWRRCLRAGNRSKSSS